MNEEAPSPAPKYAWPKYALAAVILFVLLSVLWLLGEVARVKSIKALRSAPTNASTPAER